MARDNVDIIIKATDQASPAIRSLRGELGGMASQFVPFLAGGAIAAGVVSFFKDSIELAGKEEVALNRLSGTLKRNGMEYKENTESIRAMSNQLQFQTGVAEELIDEGYNRLIIAGFSVSDAHYTMRIALDAAAASGMDLNTVLVAMIKNSAGSEMQLNRLAASLGIVKKDGESADELLGRIRDKTSGAAADSMDGYAGAVKRLAEGIEDLKKSVGGQLIKPLADFFGMFEKIRVSKAVIDEALPKEARLAAVNEEIDILNQEFREYEERAKRIGGRTDVGIFAEIKQQIATLEMLRSVLEIGTSLGPEKSQISKLPLIDISDIEREAADAGGTWSDTFADTVMGKLATIDISSSLNDAVDRAQSQLDDEEMARMRKLQQANINSVKHFVDEHQRLMAQAAADAKRFGDAVASSITPSIMGLIRGTQTLSESIKNLAFTLIENLINAAISKLATSLFPGGGLLSALFGGGFDNPANDAMIRKWGYDGAIHFTAGWQQAQNSGAKFPAHLAAPLMANSGGGGTTINVHFNGPITSEEFVRKSIIPQIEKLGNTKASSIVVRQPLLTGKNLNYAFGA